MKSNTYGQRWSMFRRMVLTRLDGVTYLDRIRLLQTPWFGVYLHRFDGPDPRPELHDHPWPFVTMLIKGSYVEERQEIGRRGTVVLERRLPWRPRRLRLTEAHTIVTVRPGTRSICLVGRRQREWGFYFPTGWVHYKDADTSLTYDNEVTP